MERSFPLSRSENNYGQLLRAESSPRVDCLWPRKMKWKWKWKRLRGWTGASRVSRGRLLNLIPEKHLRPERPINRLISKSSWGYLIGMIGLLKERGVEIK